MYNGIYIEHRETAVRVSQETSRSWVSEIDWKVVNIVHSEECSFAPL
jgi:hypothetical protein